MAFSKKDFIEIEFTGRVKNGEVFDSNIKGDLEKLHADHGHPIEAKPFILCLGEGMFLKSVEDFLIGKPSAPAEYEISLTPEKAFGNRDSKLIMKIPLKVFAEQKVHPSLGAVFNFDGRLAKIIAVSGGRVMADFNNPLAGKNVVYKISVKRKVEDQNEKIKAFIDFLFKRDLAFEVKEKKLFIDVEPELKGFVELFKDKFKEIFGLELIARESAKKETEKTDDKSKKLGIKESKSQ